MTSIGDKVWFRGEELTITGNPYKLYGGLFVDAVGGDGNTKTIPAEEQIAISAGMAIDEFRNAQAGFSRLAKLEGRA